MRDALLTNTRQAKTGHWYPCRFQLVRHMQVCGLQQSILQGDVQCLGNIFLDGRRIGKLTNDANLTDRASEPLFLSTQNMSSESAASLAVFHQPRQPLAVQTERHLVGTSAVSLGSYLESALQSKLSRRLVV
jgi:hypothetical protein